MKKETTKKVPAKKAVTTKVVTTEVTTVETKVQPAAKPAKKSVKAKIVAAEHKIVDAVVKAEHKIVDALHHKKPEVVADAPAPAARPVPGKPVSYSEVTIAKKAVIVYAHPYNGSYAAATLEAAKKGFEAKGKKYEVIDLHAEKFDPVYHGPELARYARGEVVDQQAQKYANMIKEADELVLIYPIWWSGMPAIMKGFCDKVFLSNDGFWETLSPKGVFPFLWGRSTWIKRVSIFTTSFTPNIVSKLMLGAPYKKQAVNGTFKAMRMRSVKMYNIDRVKTRSMACKKRHLNKVTKICAKELYK